MLTVVGAGYRAHNEAKLAHLCRSTNDREQSPLDIVSGLDAGDTQEGKTNKQSKLRSKFLYLRKYLWNPLQG